MPPVHTTRLRRRQLPAVLAISMFMLCSDTLLAADDEARLYRNREEQRDAGIKHELTSWLVVSGLAESEWHSEKRSIIDLPDHDRYQDTSSSLQLASFIQASENASAELIFEYDSSTDEWTSSEAFLLLEHNAWELSLGRQDIAFGEYFSRFASGPIIEYGETSASAISLAYDYQDLVDVSISVYRGRGQAATGTDPIDWSIAVEAWPADQLSFGLSYLSDLADSDERLLADYDHRYADRVAAWSGYLLWLQNDVEISLEAVAAMGEFVELETDRNQPFAWNLELAYFINSKLGCAVRLEASRELEDAPQRQAGIALNYRLHRYAALTIEALHGSYAVPLASNDNDQEYDTVDTLAAQLSIVF